MCMYRLFYTDQQPTYLRTFPYVSSNENPLYSNVHVHMYYYYLNLFHHHCIVNVKPLIIDLIINDYGNIIEICTQIIY